ncbi:hypothetical protein D3C84_1274140 [compost metagenome]
MVPESVKEPALLTVASPLRLIALSMVVGPVTESVVPLFSVTAPLPRLPSLLTDSVPELTVVVPA